MRFAKIIERGVSFATISVVKSSFSKENNSGENFGIVFTRFLKAYFQQRSEKFFNWN